MIRRHDLVWLRPEVCSQLALDADAALAQWLARRRPAIVTRRNGEAQHALALGVALPNRKRIAFSVAASAVEAVRPPLALREVIAATPKAWQRHLASLDAALSRCDPRVYGSLAWQQLTGDVYLTADSDVDLLLAPRNFSDLRKTLRVLSEARAPFALDGEILLPGSDQAVAWRELARSPRELLVKSLRDVKLVAFDQAVAAFPEVST
jgi:phosphoribosyl-dephospho-CoA transferase